MSNNVEEQNVEAASSDTEATGEHLEMEEAGNTSESTTQGENSKYPVHQRAETGDLFAPIGDNIHFTVNRTFTVNHYNDLHKLMRSVEKRSLYGGDIEELALDDDGSLDELLKRSLLFERQSVPHFDNRTPIIRGELPDDEEKFSTWYYDLGEYEQCYIQAIAILHGAKAQEIYTGADSLYKIVQKQKYSLHQQAFSQQEVQSEIQRFPMIAFSRQPSLQLQKRTYTITRLINGAECLFWQDVNNYGVSDFGARVLIFLAREFSSKGEHWVSFSEHIQSWSSRQKGYSLRAAHALGVILWYQDVNQLRSKARDWAKAATSSRRRLTASLLNGAREIELIELGEQVKDRANSSVFQLLDEWREQLHDNMNKTNTNLGCAAANTYSSLGKRSQDINISLQALNDLLTIKQYKNIDIDNARKLFATSISSYVSFVWSGHLREVLRCLAGAAENIVLRRTPHVALEQRYYYLQLREVRLNTLFETFLLIAATATPGTTNAAPEAYTQEFSEQIAIPDPYERDTLFAAIMNGDNLRQSLLTLLCAAIVSLNGKQVFELIRQWANFVIGLQQITDTVSRQLYGIFIHFMVELGKIIDEWSRDLTSRNYREPGVGDIYQHKLRQWEEEGRIHKSPIGTLARQILEQLSQ